MTRRTHDCDSGLCKAETIQVYGVLLNKTAQLMLKNPRAGAGEILKELKGGRVAEI